MEPRPEAIRQRKIDLTPLLLKMRLEAAAHFLRAGRGTFDPAQVAAMIGAHQSRAVRLRAAGWIGAARRQSRRAFALSGLLAYGGDISRWVAEVELPDGYRGKILLVVLNGGGFAGTVCLRSGDGWHHEILRNTQAELKDLGFIHARVEPLGGAFSRFEEDGAIVIWGTSDAYGCCDKEEAARMIARAYPGRPVRIEE
jgi:hypothetical protein